MTEERNPIQASIAVTYNPETEKYLLLKKAEGHVHAGTWEFPGGGVEQGETPEESALRELEEETDLSGELEMFGEVYEREVAGRTVLFHTFLIKVNSENVELSEEHQDYKWVSEEGVLNSNTHDEYEVVLESVDDELEGDVAVAVPRKDDGKLLSMKRSEKESSTGYWEFAGGEIEEEEKPREAAIRELKEETGLEGEIVHSGDFYFSKGERGKWRIHPFLVDVEGSVELSQEHSDFKWVSLEEIRELETLGKLKALKSLEMIK